MLTVSTFLDGEFGLHDVCLSVQCIVSQKGVEAIVESPLPEAELASLAASAAVLKNALAQLEAEEG